MIAWYKKIDWNKILVSDWEEKCFLTTIDGKIENALRYSKEEIISCKHVDDFPGYTLFMELTHLNPEAEDNRGRGAQQFSNDSLLIYHKNLLMRGALQIGLPKHRTPRIIYEAGYEDDKTKSFLAWFIKIQKDHEKILSWFKPWHPWTEKEKLRHDLREESRRDSTYLLDRASSIEYDHPDLKDMEAILLQGFDRLSEEAKEDRDIRFVNKGKKNEYLKFNKPACMSLYWSYCKEGGELRTDTRGQPLGVRTILYGLLQHHAHNAGKRSGAACRAYLRHHLLVSEENRDRKKNGIKIKIKELKNNDPDVYEVGGFNEPRPLVRARHEKVNKEILRLIRDAKLKI